MSEQRMLALGAKYGFAPSPRPGFVGMARTTPGTVQRLDVFFWSNRKHADAHGIPRSYAVLEVAGRRYRLPLVEWPSPTQPRRPWADVEAEFDEVFGPVLTASENGQEAPWERLEGNARYGLT